MAEQCKTLRCVWCIFSWFLGTCHPKDWPRKLEWLMGQIGIAAWIGPHCKVKVTFLDGIRDWKGWLSAVPCTYSGGLKEDASGLHGYILLKRQGQVFLKETILFLIKCFLKKLGASWLRDNIVSWRGWVFLKDTILFLVGCLKRQYCFLKEVGCFSRR